MINLKSVSLILILALSVFPLAPTAEGTGGEKVSKVSGISGEAYVVRNGQVSPLDEGMDIYRGDSITTASPGKIKLVGPDGSTLYLGSDSVMTVLDSGNVGLKRGTLRVLNRSLFRIQPQGADEIRAKSPGSEFVVNVNDAVEVIALRNKVTMGAVRVAPQVSATKRPGEWTVFRSLSLVETDALFAAVSDYFPKAPVPASPAPMPTAVEMSRPVETAETTPTRPAVQPEIVETPRAYTYEPSVETYGTEPRETEAYAPGSTGSDSAPQYTAPAEVVETTPPSRYEPAVYNYRAKPQGNQADLSSTMKLDDAAATQTYGSETIATMHAQRTHEPADTSPGMKDAGGLVGWLFGGESKPSPSATDYSELHASTDKSSHALHESYGTSTSYSTPQTGVTRRGEIGGLLGWMVNENSDSLGQSPKSVRQTSDEIGGLVGWWVGDQYDAPGMDTEHRTSPTTEPETLIGGLPE